MRPRAVVFDFYGTLFDVRGVAESLTQYTAQADQVAEEWRKRQLQLAMQAASTRRYRDFDVITAEALRDIAPRFYLQFTNEDLARLVGAWRAIDPHPDTRPALDALRALGLPLAILSNGTPASLAAALDRAALTGYFEAVLSADTVKTFKTQAAVYELATKHFGVPADEIAFVSANDWDAQGAAQFGFRAIWCNRGRPAGPRRERTIASLEELPALLAE